RGQITDAFAALERHAWYPSGRRDGAASFRQRQLDKLMERVVRRRVIKLVSLKAPARGMDPAPHYSPLSFHPDGSLLILTSEGVVRSAPDGRYEYDASEEIDGWPTAVVSPTGETLTALAFPCARSDVVWLRGAADGSPLEPLPTPLVAPRPGHCGPRLAIGLPEVAALGWTASAPSAFIGASRVGDPPTPVPMGSALSPNGKFAIVLTRWGL